MLFLTLSIQHNNVNADDGDTSRFDPSSTVAPNTSTTTHFGLNITGEKAEMKALLSARCFPIFLEVLRFQFAKRKKRQRKAMIYDGKFIIEKPFRLYITTGREREREKDGRKRDRAMPFAEKPLSEGRKTFWD